MQLPEEISSADIVIATTAAPHLINREMLEPICNERRKDMLLIDLGVPRNIDESVRKIKDVRLYNIDDLEPVIKRTIRDRAIEAEKAEKIVQKKIILSGPHAMPEMDGPSLCELSFSE
jgi:glutamyl-tRNA reductase